MPRLTVRAAEREMERMRAEMASEFCVLQNSLVVQLVTHGEPQPSDEELQRKYSQPCPLHAFHMPLVVLIQKYTGWSEPEELPVRVEGPSEPGRVVPPGLPQSPQDASASAPMPEPQPEAPRASEGACGPASDAVIELFPTSRPMPLPGLCGPWIGG